MIIYGKNAIKEAILSNLTINKLYVENGVKDETGQAILNLAKQNKIKISFEQKNILFQKCQTPKHQGFVAETTEFEYCKTSDILNKATKKEELPFVLILDGIMDPHNLGAIIRTAEASGVHGIILQKDRACAVNETVFKTSAGALSNMLIARVVNLSKEIEYLKKQGLWVFGLELGGAGIFKSNLTGPIAIVIGSEGNGLKDLVRKNCDNIITLPMKGQINSLNASVATGIAVYEILRQRGN
ncbi:MAG: 23S rRNA (guanosine(2251)-2'-O)-methyltransferase RlmB [Clostridia bacterium]|nr:23S rRNA (guanosine(2251)-2'-O)-methyltransferase RlmB [Clostridia bacterium]